MSTDKYQNPLVSRYASAEMSYVDIERRRDRAREAESRDIEAARQTERQGGSIREKQRADIRRSRESECTLTPHANTLRTHAHTTHTTHTRATPNTPLGNGVHLFPLFLSFVH